MSTAESIMVGMRLRPLVGKSEQGQSHCIKIEDQHTVSILDGANMDGPKEFRFDVAMDSTDPKSPDFVSQERCYDLMGKRMLDHMLTGYNTCLFCYGQTGTGKTTTIMGKAQPQSEQGLLMRLISDIFGEVEKLRAGGYEVHVKVQMLEVYNERLNDLIADKQSPDAHRKKIDIHVHPDLGVYLTGATEAPIENFQDCITLIEYGNTMKTVHATMMNAQSSRGHTVFKLRMDKKGGNDNMTLSSEVYFADLAGRENEKTTKVTGDRLVELSFINRSLMWLTTCIQSLGGQGSSEKRKTLAGGTPPKADPSMRRRTTVKPQVNDMSRFRNSKLTLLLSNALSGNSRTTMIGTLSPALANFEESYSTLKFASTVKNIKLVAKAATGVDKESLVKKLQQEVQELKKQLQEAKSHGGGGSDDSESEVEDLSNKLQAAEAIVESEAKDWVALKEEEHKIGRNRLLTMEKMGKRSITPARGGNSSANFPYLANYSEDPHLAFTLVFHVAPDGKEKSAGSSSSCDFTLPLGLGVTDTTCWLRNQEGQLLVKAARSEVGGLSKVEVNCLSLGEAWQELANLDCLLFGRSTTFFAFLKPTTSEEINAKVWSVFHQTEEVAGDVLVSSILGEERSNNPMAVQLARQYYTQLEKQNMSNEGSAILRKFLHSARNARKRVEEANDITKAMRPSSGLQFHLIAEAPVMAFGFGHANLPELGVRLVCRNAKSYWKVARKSMALGMDSATALHGVVQEILHPEEGGVELISVWSWEKFTSRLELMHAEYDAWSEDPSEYKVNPLTDPWAEFGPAEMLELQQECEDEREKARERVQAEGRLREEVGQLRAREARLDADNRAMQREMQALRSELARERERRKQACATSNESSPGPLPNTPPGADPAALTLLESDQVARCLELTRTNHELMQKLLSTRRS